MSQEDFQQPGDIHRSISPDQFQQDLALPVIQEVLHRPLRAQGQDVIQEHLLDPGAVCRQLVLEISPVFGFGAHRIDGEFEFRQTVHEHLHPGRDPAHHIGVGAFRQ